RAHSNFDHVVDAHRRRVALALSNIDQSLAASAKDDSSSLSSSSAPGRSFRDDSLPIPQGFLDLAVMPDHADRSTLRPRHVRPPPPPNNTNGSAHNNHNTHHHNTRASDSGIGSSIVPSSHKRAADAAAAASAPHSHSHSHTASRRDGKAPVGALA